MNILINASNTKGGGGQQVADSICCCLNEIPQHSFVVVLNSFMNDTEQRIKNYNNVKIIRHNIKNNWSTFILGRDKVLDDAVNSNMIDAVLTIFGPSRWIPRCKHLCGFARAQLIMHKSPYYTMMPWYNKIKAYMIHNIWSWAFWRCSKVFYTENPLTSKMLEQYYKNVKVYTVTNYYNQVFDNPFDWIEHLLNPFDGIQMLSVTGPGSWKNLKIAHEAARILRQQHPYFRFRFVMTIKEEQYIPVDSNLKNCFEFIGQVPVAAVPSLYQQCDISFQPTLLECFTATYPEAMRMERPIVTTNLDFAKGLCGQAARYYEATDAQACADAIYEVATNETLRKQLIKDGKEQIKTYDNYKDRARKLIEIIERL